MTQQKRRYLKKLQDENRSLRDQILGKQKKIRDIRERQESKNSKKEGAMLKKLDQQLDNL